MATAAYLPPAEGWEQRAVTVCRDGMAAIGDAVISRWFTPPFAQAAPEKVASVRDRFLEMDPRGYAVCCRVIRDMDLRQDIGSITTPTLVIAGAEDPATPVAMMEDIRARIAESELVVLPRAAHLLAIEQAVRVNRHLLSFLGAVPA
jgi:pimeloyl-ACP methyl ester carboxylesterase